MRRLPAPTGAGNQHERAPEEAGKPITGSSPSVRHEFSLILTFFYCKRTKHLKKMIALTIR